MLSFWAVQYIQIQSASSRFLTIKDHNTQISADGQQVPSASQQHQTIQHQKAIQQQTANIPHDAKRTLAQRRFTRAEQFLSEVLNKKVNDVPKTLIEQRYSELKQIWIEFQVAHDEYIVIDLKDADAAIVNAEDQIINNSAKIFSNIEIVVHRKLRELTITEKNRKHSTSRDTPATTLHKI